MSDLPQELIGAFAEAVLAATSTDIPKMEKGLRETLISSRWANTRRHWSGFNRTRP